MPCAERAPWRVSTLRGGYPTSMEARRPSSILLAAALCAALALSACGETDNAELKRRIQTLSAIAAEGQILADGVARDRTKATFARVHGRTLAEEAQHEAEKMADAQVAPGLGREREQAVAIAQRLSDALALIQTYPGGERKGAQARRAIAGAGAEADALDARIPESAP